MIVRDVNTFLAGKGYTKIAKLPNPLHRRNREYFTALDSRGRKVFIKYRQDFQDLKNEYDTLLFLEEKELGNFTPKSHGLYQIESGTLLVVDFIKGEILSEESYGINPDYNKFINKIQAFLNFDKSFPESETTFLVTKDLEFFQGKISKYSQIITSRHPTLHEDVIKILDLTCPEIKLNLQHGDFFNINIYLDTDNNLRVLDWELSCMSSRFLDIAMIINKNYLNSDFTSNLVKNVHSLSGTEENDEFNIVLGYLILKELKILIDVGDELESITHLKSYYDIMMNKLKIFTEMIDKKLSPIEIVHGLI